jgi:hypothetical protein
MERAEGEIVEMKRPKDVKLKFCLKTTYLTRN